MLSGLVAWGFVAYQALYYDIFVDQLVEESLHEQQHLEFYGLWKRASKLGVGMLSQDAIEIEIAAKEYALHGLMAKLQSHKGLQAALGADLLAVTPLYPAVTWSGETIEDERTIMEKESGGKSWMSHFILTPVRSTQQVPGGGHTPRQRSKAAGHDGVAHVSAVMERKISRPVEEGQPEQEEWVPVKLKVAVWSGQPLKEIIHTQALPHGLGYTNFKLKDPAVAGNNH